MKQTADGKYGVDDIDAGTARWPRKFSHAVPREDTQFKKGHARPEKASRRKGTPNKPKTIKLAWKEFTSEQGEEMKAFAQHVLFELPNVLEVGDKIVNMVPHKIAFLDKALKYGIGLPAKQAAYAGHTTLQMVRHPVGVDPIEERRKAEALEDAKDDDFHSVSLFGCRLCGRLAGNRAA